MDEQDRKCEYEDTGHRGEEEEAVPSEHERLIEEKNSQTDEHRVQMEDEAESNETHDAEGTDAETDPLCESDTDCTQSCASSMQGSPLPSKKFLAEQMDSSPETYVTNPSLYPLKKYLSTEMECSREDCHSCMTSTNVTPVPYRKFKPPESDAGTDLLPICRICQLPGDDDDVLFSPCRCSGSLRYVHYSCLLKWIEVCSRKTKKPPKCELCFFPYIRHKRFKLNIGR